eukprot:Protomagalhaensia_wolfi_Nauph_80__5059@NODE_536_length_2347_cov_357_390815_g397_i0_p3_GENE_NODE_536_length_2347_cov_357_390815_g397_i0NODE_536_length_2347_cov_357_390815_g397_i0_p3_ORF_typecomplete_len185_score35_93Ribosomal_S27/PF01599_19/6_9e17ubiquitin/PF00240_23/0_00016ubiquitin/PF00240_23/7_7e03IBR/PF01485_21/0_0024zfNADHPPase/PF09297_11/3_2e03zfNADHPPase/PF09297_11/1_6e03zfNADHPPase/PF09297_11/0_32_NODE_536_length_2347_cov_357_390815_g397_i06831237
MGPNTLVHQLRKSTAIGDLTFLWWAIFFFPVTTSTMVQVHARTCLGTRVCDLEDGSTIRTLKEELSAKEGVPTNVMQLVAGGLPLEDSFELALLQTEVTVNYDLDGGAKGKKKKKNYTTPKHVAHKKKKVKLAILKYYRIEENSITPTRISCIRPSCGKGVFLAAHADRAHCGKCGTTLRKVEN